MITSIPDALRRAAASTGGELVFHLPEVVRLPAGLILEEARAAAATLQERGIRPGDPVGVLGPNRPQWVRWAFGVWLAGGVVVPLAHPLRVRDRGALREQVAAAAAIAGCRLVVSSPSLLDTVSRAPALSWDRGAPPAPLDLPAVRSEDGAVIQFTSGSTGAPRGALLTHGAVLAALDAIGGAYGVRPGRDRYAGWLPFFHDNGIFGYLLRPLFHGCQGHLVPTETFARSPADWLRLVSRVGATVTSGPPSAWAAALRDAEGDRTEIDLSSLRFAVLAAEPIDPVVVDRLRSASWTGLRPEAVGGAYGMSEATLGVTASEPGRALRIDVVDRDALSAGRADPGDGAAARRVVSCGRPLPGVDLRIGDRGLPERRVGEIHLRTPSLMKGYVGGGPSPLVDGWLRTGDLGYVADGELFVTGRSKDMVIVLGRNYSPEDFEWAAGRIAGVRAGRCVAFSDPKGGEAVVLCVEPLGEGEPDLAVRVRRGVADVVGLVPRSVLVLPRGGIPKTTSGKVRRSALREAYARGELSPLMASTAPGS